MNEISKTILKWIVIGVVFILVIVLLTNVFNKNSASSKKNAIPASNGDVVNNYDKGYDDLEDIDLNDGLDKGDAAPSDEDLEDVNLDDGDLDGVKETAGSLESNSENPNYVNLPDTGASGLLMNILGIAITTIGIIYVRQNRKVEVK